MHIQTLWRPALVLVLLVCGMAACWAGGWGAPLPEGKTPAWLIRG